MLKTIRLDLLSDALRERVLKEYRPEVGAMKLLTYEEAAWYYGFTYQTIRHMVHRERLYPVKKGGYRYLTRAEMRRYFRSKKVAGSPRKSQRNQLALA